MLYLWTINSPGGVTSMPVFECAGARINLPEGMSYITVAGKYTAEWKLCQPMILGRQYKVSCVQGKLVVEEHNDNAKTS